MYEQPKQEYAKYESTAYPPPAYAPVQPYPYAMPYRNRRNPLVFMVPLMIVMALLILGLSLSLFGYSSPDNREIAAIGMPLQHQLVSPKEIAPMMKPQLKGLPSAPSAPSGLLTDLSDYQLVITPNGARNNDNSTFTLDGVTADEAEVIAKELGLGWQAELSPHPDQSVLVPLGPNLTLSCDTDGSCVLGQRVNK